MRPRVPEWRSPVAALALGSVGRRLSGLGKGSLLFEASGRPGCGPRGGGWKRGQDMLGISSAGCEWRGDPVFSWPPPPAEMRGSDGQACSP